MNGHARYAARAAAKLGFAFRSLDGADCYLFEVQDGEGRVARLAGGPASPYALNTAAAAGVARDKGFAAAVLAAAGVPCVPGALFFITSRHASVRAPGREPADAHAAAARFAYPVFCKPVSSSRGDGAERIADAAAFLDYVARQAPRHDAILVQPVIEAAEHRVLVLHGLALCAYRKRPPEVIGDGAAPLAALVEQARRNAAPTTAAYAPAERAIGRGAGDRLLGGADVPASGEVVRLLGAANRAAGGDADPILAPAPVPLATLALRAAAAVGLDFAGVDLFETAEGGMVIEVNASPALHTLEAQGRWDLIETIWAANLKAALR